MRRIGWILLAFVVVAIVIQFFRPGIAPLPVNRSHTMQSWMYVPANVDLMIRRACYDCHSNETKWPWYARIAPVSWWVKRDVSEGRQELNFSEFATYSKVRKTRELQAAFEEVRTGDMPLRTYLAMHKNAQLSEADKKAFCAWARSSKGAIEETMTPAELAQEKRPRAPQS